MFIIVQYFSCPLGSLTDSPESGRKHGVLVRAKQHHGSTGSNTIIRLSSLQYNHDHQHQPLMLHNLIQHTQTSQQKLG